MKKNLYKDICIIACCILFIILSITSTILATNVLHTGHCLVHNCTTCTLIVMGTNFIKNINMEFINISLLLVIIPLIQLIKKSREVNRNTTLVECKVIQNN